jgi:hypothetical protein
MANPGNRDDSGVIVYLIQDAPVADPDAPRGRAAVAQEEASWWARVLSQAAQHSDDALRDLRGEPPDAAFSRGRDDDPH